MSREIARLNKTLLPDNFFTALRLKDCRKASRYFSGNNVLRREKMVEVARSQGELLRNYEVGLKWLNGCDQPS
jgi:hypothetical protein